LAFESEGYGEVARALQGLARAQRWDEMAGLVDDEMLDRYAVIGTYEEIAAKLNARYAPLATSLEFGIPLSDAGDEARLRGLIASLRSGRGATQ
jgi:alkanesulfonate monooxygenase SsuD/methylene tetrahydromethanopterin reductase-like flavin-dependent oxidoreductase (luciferase family)